jgi:hypothetical protein
LPIQPDYRGRQVDAINNEKVKVEWSENNGEDVVYLVTTENLKVKRILFYKNKIIVKE